MEITDQQGGHASVAESAAARSLLGSKSRVSWRQTGGHTVGFEVSVDGEVVGRPYYRDEMEALVARLRAEHDPPELGQLCLF